MKFIKAIRKVQLLTDVTLRPSGRLVPEGTVGELAQEQRDHVILDIKGTWHRFSKKIVKFL